jgi:hypothetical protein
VDAGLPPSVEPSSVVERPSFLSRILDEVERRPDAPLPISTLVAWSTPIAKGTAEVPLAPGVLDAMHARMPNADGWQRAREVMSDVTAGRVLDWRVVEERLRELRVAPALKAFLDHLTPSDVAPTVAETFWALARLSGHEEPVKWGILLGSIHPAPIQTAELLLFARHPEFARYAVPALRILAQRDPDVIGELVALLPLTTGYATVHLARGLLAESRALDDEGTQRMLIIEGMKRGIKAELAVPFALRLSIDALANTAREDDTLFEALVMMVNGIVYDGAAASPQQRVDAFERVARPYLSLLEARGGDVRAWSGLVTLREFLANVGDDAGIADREWRRGQVDRLLETRVDREGLRRGLERKQTRALSLHVIDGVGAADLAPAMAAIFRTEPDLLLADVLSKLGGAAELETLRELLPRLVDLEARANVPIRHDSNVSAVDHVHRLFAVVVRGMGRLGTPEAIDLLKRACRDFHPWGRAAACEGISFLPSASVDDELRTLLRERMTDSPEYIVNEARRAASALGLDT